MSTGEVPSYEAQRFDRQLRLWGHEGQRALEDAHVCLLGVSSAGSEMLKNMVLPNLGFFTVVDERVVMERDVGNNFFVHPSDLDTPIAEAVVKGLGELNTRSTGIALVVNPVEFVASNLATLVTSMTIIVCSSHIPQSVVREIAKQVEHDSCTCSLMVVEACGLLGVLRIYSHDRFIIHSHPDAPVMDLRSITPFPSLAAWFEGCNPDDPRFADDLTLHSHIPWPCVIYHAVKRVRARLQNDTWSPRVGSDFVEVRKEIDSMVRRREPLEASFEEAKAMANAYSLLLHTRFERSRVAALLQDPRAVAPSANDDIAWFLLHSLRTFVAAHKGELPATGTLPDFSTTTAWFQQLQQLYRDESASNAKEILDVALAAVSKANKTSGVPSLESVAEISRDLVKNCWELDYVHFFPVSRELDDQQRIALKMLAASNNDSAFLEWYCVHRAARRFHELYNRHAGDVASLAAVQDESVLSEDTEALRRLVSEITSSSVCCEGLPITAEGIAQRTREIVRYGGGDINMTASIIGAVASQEAIKLVQNRRVPGHDVILFDGTTSSFGSVCLQAL